MANLTLPQIVSSVRQQKPGVVPLSLWLDEAGWCDTGCSNTYRMTEETVIAVLEAAMWRESAKQDDGDVWWSGVPEPQWNAMAPGQAMGDDTQSFGSDPLALIRALCHAIGVRLEATNA